MNAHTVSLTFVSAVCIFILVVLGYPFAAFIVAAGVFYFIWRPR